MCSLYPKDPAAIPLGTFVRAVLLRWMSETDGSCISCSRSAGIPAGQRAGHWTATFRTVSQTNRHSPSSGGRGTTDRCDSRVTTRVPHLGGEHLSDKPAPRRRMIACIILLVFLVPPRASGTEPGLRGSHSSLILIPNAAYGSRLIRSLCVHTAVLYCTLCGRVCAPSSYT
eukprot:SAG25_NODE_220_length_11624_cov_41.246508_9_plen_171_part_00